MFLERSSKRQEFGFVLFFGDSGPDPDDIAESWVLVGGGEDDCGSDSDEWVLVVLVVNGVNAGDNKDIREGRDGEAEAGVFGPSASEDFVGL